MGLHPDDDTPLDRDRSGHVAGIDDVSSAVKEPAPLDRVRMDLAPQVDTDELELEECFKAHRSLIPFSMARCRDIADYYAEGFSLAKISRMPGMPRQPTIYKWHRESAEFRELIRGARQTRALTAEDHIAEIAEGAESLGKDDVPGARLAFEAEKWRAEVNDPEVYGKRTTIQGDVGRPIVFQVVSRIPESDREKAAKTIANVVVLDPVATEPLTPEDPDEGPNVA